MLVFAFGLISSAEFRNSSSSEREKEGESARYEQVGEKMELQQIIERFYDTMSRSKERAKSLRR